MPDPLIALTSGALALLLLGALGARRLIAVGRPDEWLLQIRDGRCVRAGVGLVSLRRPFDQIVRFTSTVQRVSFDAQVLTRDRVEATVEGYVLWSIGGDGAPFIAFQRLGLTSAEGDAPAARHLLSKPQFRAFRTAFSAAARLRGAEQDFAALALDPAPLLDALRSDVRATLGDLGAQLDEVQLLSIRASDASVQADHTAASRELLREAAETARVEAERRLKALRAEAAEVAARREIEAARARDAQQIAAELALEAERQRLSQAREARADAALEARLARERREAEAAAERIRLLAAAESDKGHALRADELERLRIERAADAIRALPLKEARWYSLGSPLALLEDLARGALGGRGGEGD